LTNTFERIFKARGIHKPFAFLKRAGFSDSFASKVKNNRVSRLDLRMIERLCIAFRCAPHDLMEWIPDSDSDVDAAHPISVIRRSDKLIDITKTLNNIPLNQLDEVDELIKQHVADKYKNHLDM
jgi:DNA-binding Xre family transcriptional regulator